MTENTLVPNPALTNWTGPLGLPDFAAIADQDYKPAFVDAFAAHPDLSFAQLNGDRPLTSSPHQPDGLVERVGLIRDKLPGVEEVVMRTPPKGAAQLHVLQAAGLVWTARRAAGRAMQRLPLDPAWDTAGMRMELVR